MVEGAYYSAGSRYVTADTPGKPPLEYRLFRKDLEGGSYEVIEVEPGAPSAEGLTVYSGPTGGRRVVSSESVARDQAFRASDQEARKAAEAERRQAFEREGRSYIVPEGSQTARDISTPRSGNEALRLAEAAQARRAAETPFSGSYLNPLAVSAGFERKLKGVDSKTLASDFALGGGVGGAIKGEAGPSGEVLQFVKVGGRGEALQSFQSGYTEVKPQVVKDDYIFTSEQKTAFEKRVESLIAREEAAAARSQRTVDFFRTVPGLGGDNIIQRGARGVLAAPAVVLFGGAEQAMLAGGKVSAFGEAIVKGGSYRQAAFSEVGRAAKATPGAVFGTFTTAESFAPALIGSFAGVKGGVKPGGFKTTRATGRGAYYELVEAEGSGLAKTRSLFLETETKVSKAKPSVAEAVIFQGKGKSGMVVDLPSEGGLVSRGVLKETIGIPEKASGSTFKGLRARQRDIAASVEGVGSRAALRVAKEPVIIKGQGSEVITTPSTVVPLFEGFKPKSSGASLKIFSDKQGRGVAQITAKSLVDTSPSAPFGFMQGTVIGEGSVIDFIRQTKPSVPSARVVPKKFMPDKVQPDFFGKGLTRGELRFDQQALRIEGAVQKLLQIRQAKRAKSVLPGGAVLSVSKLPSQRQFNLPALTGSASVGSRFPAETAQAAAFESFADSFGKASSLPSPPSRFNTGRVQLPTVIYEQEYTRPTRSRSASASSLRISPSLALLPRQQVRSSTLFSQSSRSATGNVLRPLTALGISSVQRPDIATMQQARQRQALTSRQITRQSTLQRQIGELLPQPRGVFALPGFKDYSLPSAKGKKRGRSALEDLGITSSFKAFGLGIFGKLPKAKKGRKFTEFDLRPLVKGKGVRL